MFDWVRLKGSKRSKYEYGGAVIVFSVHMTRLLKAATLEMDELGRDGPTVHYRLKIT